MFVGPEPLFDLNESVPKEEDAYYSGQVTPSTTPVPTAPELPSNPQAAESLNATSNPEVLEPSGEDTTPRDGDGWYVAFHAALPGTYYGV